MKNFNYLREKSRMLKSIGGGAKYDKTCHGECVDCALSFNQYGEGCIVFEIRHPEEAEAAVRKWAEEHPRQTRLGYLLERFPDVEMQTDPGDTVDLKYPQVCAKALGIEGVDCDKHNNCYECWHVVL